MKIIRPQLPGNELRSDADRIRWAAEWLRTLSMSALPGPWELENWTNPTGNDATFADVEHYVSAVSPALVVAFAEAMTGSAHFWNDLHPDLAHAFSRVADTVIDLSENNL